MDSALKSGTETVLLEGDLAHVMMFVFIVILVWIVRKLMVENAKLGDRINRLAQGITKIATMLEERR